MKLDFAASVGVTLWGWSKFILKHWRDIDWLVYGHRVGMHGIAGCMVVLMAFMHDCTAKGASANSTGACAAKVLVGAENQIAMTRKHSCIRLFWSTKRVPPFEDLKCT